MAQICLKPHPHPGLPLEGEGVGFHLILRLNIVANHDRCQFDQVITFHGVGGSLAQEKSLLVSPKLETFILLSSGVLLRYCRLQLLLPCYFAQAQRFRGHLGHADPFDLCEQSG